MIKLFFIITGFCVSLTYGGEKLIVFVGAASKPPTEEIAQLFERETGVKVEVIYGGSGYILSQMLLSKTGDIYFPGSSDFMEVAKEKKVVLPETERRVAYLVPAINVQRGNPKGIKTLKDLTRPGVRVAIANPENVCIGLYAVEIVEKNLNDSEKDMFRKNLVNYTTSCEKTATAISLKMVDAVIGWSVFEHWSPDKIETVPFKTSEISRIGYLPVAVSRFTRNKKRSLEFINFLLSPKAKKVFKRHRYFVTPDDAIKYIGEPKPIGGKYYMQGGWLQR